MADFEPAGDQSKAICELVVVPAGRLA